MKNKNNMGLFKEVDRLLDEVSKKMKKSKDESTASASAGLPGFDMPHTGKPYNGKDKKRKKKIMRYMESDEEKTEITDREKNRIMIDFDGVIHSYHEGYKDGSIYGYVIENTKETIDELSIDHQIVIFTTRVSEGHNVDQGESVEEKRKQIENWLSENEIFFDFITADKLPAIVYIDDKAIRFENNWCDVKSKIKGL